MLNLNFSPFPVLSSGNVVLRQLHEHDAPAIFRLRSDEKLMKFIPRLRATSVEDARLLIENFNSGLPDNSSIIWGITLKDEDQVIGTIGYRTISKENYRAEIGYMLHHDYHGKGIIGRALEAAVRYGFEVMKLHSIVAVVDAENTASLKLLEKNKFIKEGYFRDSQFYNGRFHDNVHYSRLRTDG